MGVGLLRSYQSVPPNLAANLDVRKRSDVMTFSKKGRKYRYLYQPLSEVRPLWLLGSDVSGDRWCFIISCPAFQQIPLNGDSMGSARREAEL